MIKLNGSRINITTFPDKTSQVWKLEHIDDSGENEIDWEYENDAEIFHLCQLIQLLVSENPSGKIDVWMMTLPYARQDKEVSNETTFALNTLLTILDSVRNINTKFYAVDIHNPKILPSWVINIMPKNNLRRIIEKSNPDLICFPDKGASERGYEIGEINSIFLDKKRDQLTGQILGLEYLGDNLDAIIDANVLIIDDLCDGGGTFIAAAEILYKLGAKNVDLYTTHGIYSRGIDHVRSTGIKRIFNLNGEVK